jgi:hypothetical protein
LYESWNQNINFTQTSTTLYTDRFGGGMFFKNVVNTHVSDTIISTVYNPDGITYTETVDVLYSQARDELRLYGASTYDQGDYARMQLQYYRRRSTIDRTTYDADTNDEFSPGSPGTNQNNFYPNDVVPKLQSAVDTTEYVYPDLMPDRHAGWVANNFTPAGYNTPNYRGIPTSGMGCAVPSSTYQFTTYSQWVTLFETVVDQLLEVTGYTYDRRSLFYKLNPSEFDAEFVRGVAGSFYFDYRFGNWTVKAPWTQPNARYITIVSGPQLRENIAQTAYVYSSAGANGSYTTQPIVVFTNANRVGSQPTFSRVDDLFTVTKTTNTITSSLTVDHITELETTDYDWGKSFKIEFFDSKHSNVSDFSYAADSADLTNYRFQRDDANDYLAIISNNFYLQDWLESIYGYFQIYPQYTKTDFFAIKDDPFQCLEFYADAKRWNVKTKVLDNYEALSWSGASSNVIDQLNIVEDGYFVIPPDINMTNDSAAFQTFRIKLIGASQQLTDRSMWTIKKVTVTTYNTLGTTCPDQSYLCSVSAGTVDTDDATWNSSHEYLPAGQQVSPFRDFVITAFTFDSNYVQGGTDLTYVYRTREGCVAEWIQVRDPNATFPANHVHFAIRATFSGTLDNCDVEFKCWVTDTNLAQVQTDVNIGHDTFTLSGIDFTDSARDYTIFAEPEKVLEKYIAGTLRSRFLYNDVTNDFEIGYSSSLSNVAISSGSVPAWFTQGTVIYFGSNN